MEQIRLLKVWLLSSDTHGSTRVLISLNHYNRESTQKRYHNCPQCAFEHGAEPSAALVELVSNVFSDLSWNVFELLILQEQNALKRGVCLWFVWLKVKMFLCYFYFLFLFYKLYHSVFLSKCDFTSPKTRQRWRRCSGHLISTKTTKTEADKYLFSL